jgi:hypothetical protein
MAGPATALSALGRPDNRRRLAVPRGTRSAALAQLVEHRIRNAGVTGSNPVGGTTHSRTWF